MPLRDAKELSHLLQIHEPAADLATFLLPFQYIKLCFVDKEAIARITFEAVEDAVLDNIRYVELRFSPEGMAYEYSLDLHEVMNGIVEGLRLAERRLPVTARLIVSICRGFPTKPSGKPWPTPVEVAHLAVEYADRGVVGFDLSGIERGYPPEQFADPYRIAREAGLGLTVHAGEDAGPESIRSAIENLGATRIGHGVRIVSDSELIVLAKERGVTFEMCPTSNVLTRAVASLDEHPIRRLFDEGVSVTVNTDDPSVCGVTLTQECALLAREFGFTVAEIEQLMENARRSAFSPDASTA